MTDDNKQSTKNREGERYWDPKKYDKYADTGALPGNGIEMGYNRSVQTFCIKGHFLKYQGSQIIQALLLD